MSDKDRQSVLEEASVIIDGDREKTYGDPGLNMRRIASFWSVILGIPVSMDQVCLCMVALKMARLVHDPSHHDSQVDVCGYTAIMEKIQQHKGQ